MKPAQRRDEYRNSPQPHPPREQHECHAIKRGGRVNAGSVTKSSHSCERQDPERRLAPAGSVARATLLVDPSSRTLPRRAILPTAMPRRPGTTAATPTEALASPVRDFVVPLIAAAVRAPVVIAVTALGAGVVAGRGLLRLASSLLPSCATPAPRHHAGRVRERARAAEQAARASGLLSRRDR